MSPLIAALTERKALAEAFLEYVRSQNVPNASTDRTYERARYEYLQADKALRDARARKALEELAYAR